MGRSTCAESRKSCRIPIEFVLIDSPSLIARVAQPSDKGYVMISAGTILLLVDLFYRILAHPQSYPNIGNPAAESIQPFHQHGVERDFVVMAHARGYGIDGVRPRDDERARQAGLLAISAFQFLLLHELAHVEMGHLGYRASKKGMPLISEFEAASSGSLNVPGSDRHEKL
jgi:hypothetical protein